MSNAIAVLDAARTARPGRPTQASEAAARELMGQVFGRISFFVNAGVRFVEEHAKLRAMSILWEELGRERYGVTDPKHLRFRYGVQVNSLGPDRGPAGEQRPADRARDARRHARARRPRARDPAAGLERGARPAAPVGSAVVAADPAGDGLRDRPARVPRHLRGLARDGRARRGAAGRRARRDGRRRRARRRRRGRAVHEGRAGRLPPRSASTGSSPASRSSSGRTASPRRSSLAADRRRRGRHPGRRPRGRGRADRGRAPLALRARPGGRRRRARGPRAGRRGATPRART